MLEGVPGAGKSYHAVSEYLLPWVRANRRVYLYVDGVYLDRLALFEGRSQEELEKQLTVWKTRDEVLEGLLSVEAGSAVLVDECQTVFRAREKLVASLLRWLETHRHYGVDVVLMCQDFRQVTSGVTRLVEVTTKFRRLDRFGLKNRYQGFVRGNPEELEIIRKFVGKYDSKVYSYYSSYSQASVKEQRNMKSILSSPTVIFGLIALVFAVWFLGFHRGFGGLEVPKAQAGFEMAKSEVQSSSGMKKVVVGVDGQGVKPVRIEGGIKDKDGWLWISDDGRLLRSSDIVGLSGGTVKETVRKGIASLSGTGVIWGGLPREDVAASSSAGSGFSLSSAGETAVVPGGGMSGGRDLLSDPPSLLTTGKGLL